MKPFEGRDLPQLMELMHDLARPEPISWAPETVGWWMLLTWLLTLGLLAIGFGTRHWRRNRYRREAMALLLGIERSDRVRDMGSEIATVLKRAALFAYPRHEVASLYGTEWANFLRASCDHDPIVDAVAIELSSLAYRRDLDAREFIAAAKRWVEIHRA